MFPNIAYLATVYSKHPQGLKRAFVNAAQLAGRLMLTTGIKVYSPIAHTHLIAVYNNIDPLDHSIWLPFDEAMMVVCSTLIVANMHGWQDSKGIKHEVEFFEKARKPIFDLNVKTLMMVKR